MEWECLSCWSWSGVRRVLIRRRSDLPARQWPAHHPVRSTVPAVPSSCQLDRSQVSIDQNKLLACAGIFVHFILLLSNGVHWLTLCIVDEQSWTIGRNRRSIASVQTYRQYHSMHAWIDKQPKAFTGEFHLLVLYLGNHVAHWLYRIRPILLRQWRLLIGML